MSFNSKFKSREIEDILDKSKVYIFPFTTQDIIDATEQDIPYRLLEEQIAEILDAIETKKRILIKQYPDVEGYNVIDSIYKDDMIYVHFVDLFSSYPATSCDFAIDMSAMHVTDFRMGTIATESNLKTINGESIVGEGNIVISGGSAGSAAYPEINHGTNDTILTLAPNTFHIWDEVESLQLVCARPTAGIANEYLFQFTSGATATTLYLPDSIKWAGGSAPTIQPNMIYQISILNDLGSVLEFSNAPELIENIGVYNEGSMMSGATLTFQYPVESDLTIYFSYASSNSFTLSKGNTTLNIDWYEPFAPQITGISPTSDNIYKYVI